MSTAGFADSFKQKGYIYGSGSETRVCGRRLVITGSDEAGSVDRSLIFNCTEPDNTHDEHVATIERGAPRRPMRVEIHWWDYDDQA